MVTISVFPLFTGVVLCECGDSVLHGISVMLRDILGLAWSGSIDVTIFSG